MNRRKAVGLLASIVLTIVCCGGKIYGLSPFGAPMFCALSGEFFIGMIAPVYLLCAFLFTFDVWRLYTAGIVVFVMAVRWFLGLKLRKFDKSLAKIIASLTAIVAEALLSILFVPIVDAALSCFVGAVFYYFALRTAACAKQAFSAKPSVVDGASLCFTFVVAGLALSAATIRGYAAGLAPAMFFMLLLGATGTGNALVGGAALSLGLGLGSDIALVPSLIAAVLTLTAFKALPRPAYAAAAVGMYAATAVLFGVAAVDLGKNALFLAVGGLLFCLIPRRKISAIRAYFDFDGSARLAVRHYINRTKADAGNRMLAVASVFDETVRLMNALGDPRPDYAAIGAMLADKVCPYCAHYQECDRKKADEAFTLLAERAHAGKAILSDLPEFFTADCVRAHDVISGASAITDGARARAKERESEEKAKAIVSERLRAVKDVMEELGRSEAVPVGFDGDSETRIAAELKLNGVDCAEVFCSKAGVTAIVRSDSAARDKIKRAVSVCLKANYEITSLEKTQAAGWSVATLKRRPAYEAVYARAGIAKSGVIGDSYTFERIGDRFLAALLDGMGSGGTASETSGAAVDLIECFYRAGFDSQSVMSGVNRFLKLPATENYSAADVAVCDLDTARVDIIKIGSPPCYIKTADTVLKIEGSSLPLGVLDEMRPFVTSKQLYPGQMLIMVTDGVSDCFSGDELPEFINGLTFVNPETMVSSILSRAVELCGEPRDDMTAIAFRVFDAPKKDKKILLDAPVKTF